MKRVSALAGYFRELICLLPLSTAILILTPQVALSLPPPGWEIKITVHEAEGDVKVVRDEGPMGGKGPKEIILSTGAHTVPHYGRIVVGPHSRVTFQHGKTWQWEISAGDISVEHAFRDLFAAKIREDHNTWFLKRWLPRQGLVVLLIVGGAVISVMLVVRGIVKFILKRNWGLLPRSRFAYAGILCVIICLWSLLAVLAYRVTLLWSLTY